MRRRVVVVSLAVVVAAAMGWFVGTIDARGLRFFETGRATADALGALARAIHSRDREALASALSHDYAGIDLGLSTHALASTRDNVQHYRWRSSAASHNRAQSVDAWLAYAGAFATIEEVSLHLERLEAWQRGQTVTALARFEAIATPSGEPYAGIDRALFRVTFVRSSRGLLLQSATLLNGNRVMTAATGQPAFQNVAAAAGIDFAHQYYPRFLTRPMPFGIIRYGPGGISTADFDNDGYYDLFVPDGVAARLFRNRRDGTFEDVTGSVGLSGLDGVSVGVFADYDNDGHKDLFVSRTFEPNQLFHNNGDGTFADVTRRAGIGADCCTTVASWADYDNDGLVDLFVGRYLDPRTTIPTMFYARNGEADRLYHNAGDGTFTDVTDTAGVGDRGLCLGNAWGDYDADGWVDLFVVNDFGRSTLFHNERNGTFSDVTVKAGALAYGAGMSASMADYDNDGLLDLYTTDIRSNHIWFAEPPTVWRYMLNSWRQGVWKADMPLFYEILRQSGFGFLGVFRDMAAGNHLLRNRGDRTFEEVSLKAGANPPGWFWSASFADFDNDGWQDIYAANGWVYNERGTDMELEFLNHVISRQVEYKAGTFFDPDTFEGRSWQGWQRNRHLRNNGDGTFSEIGRAVGSDLVLNSRGVAVADYWNRGALDIAVAASNDRHALLRNDGAIGNWLAVELVGTRSNRDAVGARVWVSAGGRRQLREVAIGDGYGSQNTLRQYFGLGDGRRVDLSVFWPRSGMTQSFRDIPVNRIVQVTEGQDQLAEKTYPGVAR